jgi:hypothetical protein
MIICPNCGAKIEDDITKCPYCGYINKEGAEKKYKEDLDRIKEDIYETKKEPVKALTKGIKKGTKVIFVTIAVIIVISAVLVLELLREMKDKPKDYLSNKDQVYASAYKETAGRELATAYEDKDIQKMAEIFDKAYSVDRISLWGDPHYETGFASSRYIKLKDCLSNLDKKKIKKKEAEEITYYCFYFYYRAYGEDGAELFDPIREDEIIPLLTERLGYTTEQMDAMKDTVMDPPNLNRTALYKATKKYYKNYH